MYVIQYLRVSSEGQIDGTGYERQATSIDNFCAYKNWVPQLTAIDQVSGADADVNNRIALMDIWMHFEEIDDPDKIIVVEDSKRWARDFMVGECLLNTCRQKGIKVWSAAENIDLTVGSDDPTAKMIQQLFSILAQYDKATIVQRLKMGRMINRKTGRGRGGVEGKKPYGVQPYELSILRQMLYLRSSGWTYAQIADEFNTRGLRTRYGKAWTRRGVHKICTNERSYTLIPEVTEAVL